MPIDILAGSGTLRGDMEAGRAAADIALDWKAGLAAFEMLRQQFLLY